MQVPVWIWAISVAATIGLIVFDFFAHVRTPHEPSFKESAWWSAFYVVLAILFGLGMMWLWGAERGTEFLAGYITEKSLSVDNLFVFLIIMSSFGVPRKYQQKVLFVGVIIALILRAIFILIGAALLEHFSWTFYIFGLFLILTAVKLVLEKHDENEEYKPSMLVRSAQRILPITHEYDGANVSTVIDGKRYFTPMMIVMIAIGMTDVLFALDSVPAIYGLTEIPYIVFTANAFALLGLIQLYFLLGGLLNRLVYLNVGLALVLGFIGIKLVLHAMHGNTLAFINEGEPIRWAPEIPIWLSLTVIIVILAVTTIASLLKSANSRDSARTNA